jgi:hypothetical protein
MVSHTDMLTSWVDMQVCTYLTIHTCIHIMCSHLGSTCRYVPIWQYIRVFTSCAHILGRHAGMYLFDNTYMYSHHVLTSWVDMQVRYIPNWYIPICWHLESTCRYIHIIDAAPRVHSARAFQTPKDKQTPKDRQTPKDKESLNTAYEFQ